MRATGTLRRVDSLGRIVIPKGVRRTLHIREGDSLEIFVDCEGEVILKKYSLLRELGGFAKEYADSLYNAIGHIACITDREKVIAVSGVPKKELLNKRISAALESVMEARKAVLLVQSDQNSCWANFTEEEGECRYTAKVIAPVIAEGNPIGAVIIASTEPNTRFDDLELKLAVTAASFLAKQIEQ